VDSHSHNVLPFKVPLNFVCAVLGAREYQDAGQLAVPEEVQKKTDFLVSFDEIYVLGNCFDGVSGSANLNHQRRLLDACGEGAYFRSYGGGEEHSLAIFWHSGDDFLNVPDETHIEHSVGLIENEHLDAPEVYGTLAHMVKQPARSSDNDINTLAERGKLAFDIHAAINGEGPQMQETAIAENGLFNLHSQLTSRGKDKGTDKSFFRRMLMREAVQDRQDKGGGFAGPCLCAADDVFAGDCGGNGLGLNFGWGGVAGGKNTLHERVGKTKIFKWH
jgi:hypothetical protein